MKFKELIRRKDILVASLAVSVASAAIIFVVAACVRG